MDMEHRDDIVAAIQEYMADEYNAYGIVGVCKFYAEALRELDRQLEYFAVEAPKEDNE